MDIVKQKKLYKFNPRSLPWYSETIGEQEFVKIIGIKYEIKPQMTYFLKVILALNYLVFIENKRGFFIFLYWQLGCMDPATRTLTGKSFIVKYHDIEEVLDFFVLQQDYDSAIQRTWQPGDCFRSVVRNVRGIQVWWEGLIEEREPLSNQYPDSQFLCYRIRSVRQIMKWKAMSFNPLNFSGGKIINLTVLVHGTWKNPIQIEDLLTMRQVLERYRKRYPTYCTNRWRKNGPQ